MNGLTKARWYETAEQMAKGLSGWSVRYKFCRKHRRIGNRTPYEATVAWHRKQPELFIREPAALLAYRSQSCET